MIVLENLTKRFGSATAVDNVSFQVEKGAYFALLGPNGAGKTTIIRILMGFIRPSSGRIMIDGIGVDDPRARTHIGYIAEHHMIPPYLSGLDYLLRHAALMGLSRKDAFAEAERVIQVVSMSGRENQKSHGYSKGMRQRMGLAAAIMGQPKLLVLDEPVSGLDPIGIRQIRKILEDLKSSGMTIILNSHLLSEVEKTCDTAAIIHNGRIMINGSIDSIVTDTENLEDVFVKYVTTQ